MIGTAYTCMLLFAESSLHFAVEAGARCTSVQTTVCTSRFAITTYAQNAHYCPIVSHAFTMPPPPRATASAA